MEPMLFRRNAGLKRLEWSGCKAGESVIVRGRNSDEIANWQCRHLARGEWFALAPGREQVQVSACEVGN
jgi:hypothetical protein